MTNSVLNLVYSVLEESMTATFCCFALGDWEIVVSVWPAAKFYKGRSVQHGVTPVINMATKKQMRLQEGSAKRN